MTQVTRLSLKLAAVTTVAQPGRLEPHCQAPRLSSTLSHSQLEPQRPPGRLSASASEAPGMIIAALQPWPSEALSSRLPSAL